MKALACFREWSLQCVCTIAYYSNYSISPNPPTSQCTDKQEFDLNFFYRWRRTSDQLDDVDAKQGERMRLLHPHCLLPLVRLDDFVHLRNPQFGARRFRCVQVSCTYLKSLWYKTKLNVICRFPKISIAHKKVTCSPWGSLYLPNPADICSVPQLPPIRTISTVKAV